MRTFVLPEAHCPMILRASDQKVHAISCLAMDGAPCMSTV